MLQLFMHPHPYRVRNDIFIYSDILTLFVYIVSKGIGANMIKKESKRRRTKAEIEEEKQEEILKRQKLESDMEELANLRA